MGAAKRRKPPRRLKSRKFGLALAGGSYTKKKKSHGRRTTTARAKAKRPKK